jgi:hypothetical protein
MTPPTSSKFLAAIGAVQKALDRGEAPGMIIDGVAVVAHGVPRTTLDVDATVEGASLDLDRFVADVAACGLVPRIDDVVAFARRSQVLLLAHAPSQVDVDVTIAWLPFEIDAIARRTSATLGSTRIEVPAVGDLLVYKLVAGRPRDLDDAQRLFDVHFAEIDVRAIRAVLVELATALESDAPVQALDAMLHGTSRI